MVGNGVPTAVGVAPCNIKLFFCTMVESRYKKCSSSTARKRLFCEANFSEDGPDEGRGDQKMDDQSGASEDEIHSSNFQFSGSKEVEKHNQEDYTSSRLFCGGNTAPNGVNEEDAANWTTRDGEEEMQATTSHSSLVSLEKAETATEKGISASISVAALSAPSIHEKKQLIRVFLRLRPLPSSLLPSPEILPSRSLEVLSHTKVRTVQPTGNQTLRSQKHSEAYAKLYTFDGVYDETVTQIETYNAIAKDLVQNVSHGTSCVLFSYGATNSGKTHSIFGGEGWGACQSEGTTELEGILPRALRELLQRSGSSHANHEANTHVFVSLFEIYREKVYDLMAKRDRKTLKLELFDRDKNTWKVAGLHWLNASKIGAAEALKLLFKGTQRRHRSNNGLNATSSRSHCMCEIELRRESTASLSGTALEGVLRIVDLAGSERASKTTFEGGDFLQRRQEAININKTMLTLWQCLRGMQHQSRLFPQPSLAGIRESTLTKWICPYLFYSLPGTTVVLVSASPAADCYDETQHVLDNATTASKIRIQPSAVMSDAVQTVENSSKCSGQQQLHQHGKKRWNTSTSVDSIVTCQANCQNVKRQRPLTTADRGGGACHMTELHELRSKLFELRAENNLLSKELHEIKDNWKEKEAAILSEAMEQHEIAIRDEVAEEIGVIMGDMASEIKHLKRQVQEPPSSHAHAVLLRTKLENAHKLKTYIQDREEQIEECEAEMERMRRTHTEEISLLRDELNLTKRKLERSLLLLNNNPEKKCEGDNLPLEENVHRGGSPPPSLNDEPMPVQNDVVAALTPTADDEAPPMSKTMHFEESAALTETENNCREPPVLESSTGVSLKCTPPDVTATTGIPSLGSDLVGCEVMLHQEPNLWKPGRIVAYRPRARRLNFEIAFNEGVNDDDMTAVRRELRQDTYGFGTHDVWHLLTRSRLELPSNDMYITAKHLPT